ncbi:MAG: hypothetical protein HZA51_16210 [Planctomycetes bacterium]|nr:hypothetical protein [Planctomycetota bacterium]
MPLRFNDGRPVPDDLIASTLIDLRKRFGAVSCETQTIHGIWSSRETVYRDDLVRLFVDATDSPDVRQFFVEYKEQLKQQFSQLDIWLTSYEIDVI